MYRVISREYRSAPANLRVYMQKWFTESPGETIARKK